MQGGALAGRPQAVRQAAGGQARFIFDEGPALLLTEAGTERRAGVWVYPAGEALTSPPLSELGPEADQIAPDEMLALFARAQSAAARIPPRPARARRSRSPARQRGVPHRPSEPVRDDRQARPRWSHQGRCAIRECVDEGLAYERTARGHERLQGSPRRGPRRTGEPCPVCGDVVRAVEYSGYTVNYCATCQTGGKVLADNTTSKFLK